MKANSNATRSVRSRFGKTGHLHDRGDPLSFKIGLAASRSIKLGDCPLNASLLFVVVVEVRHHRVGGQQQSGDAGRVPQCGSDNLNRIDDAGFQHVRIDTLIAVVANIDFLLLDLINDHGAVNATIVCDLSQRSAQGAGHNVDTHLLVSLC